MTRTLLEEASNLGRIDKGVKCNVSGCGRDAVRSLSGEKVKAAGLNIGSERRAYLCKEHYKEYKKRTKKDKQLEKWRYSA
jgi:histidyl-tRNA synthetase